MSYDGKQTRPQGAISSGANKIFIHEPVLISLKGWKSLLQDNMIVRGSTCNAVHQYT